MKHKESNEKMRFLNNTSWMLAQQIYSMILSLVVGSLSARYLGPSNYGLLSYGSSLISLFTMISSLGLTNVIINEMIKRPSKVGSYLGSAFVARFIASCASLIMIYGIIFILEPDNKLLQIVTVLQGVAVVFQGYEVFTYYFQMEMQMKVVSIATMLALTAASVWRISLLAHSADVRFFALTNSIQYLVAGLVVIIIFALKSKVKLSFNILDVKYLVGKSYHLLISSIASTVCCQIDKIMIGKIMNETHLGFYSAAVTIAELWEFVPSAAVNSARPLILSRREGNYKEYERRFQLLLLGITCMGVAVSIAFMFLGDLAIKILYGKDYMEASIPLTILIWSTAVAAIGYARNVWFVAEDCQSYVKYFTIAGAVFDFVANLWFIPVFGIKGAAITTALSHIIVGFIAPLFVKKTRKFVALYFKSFLLFPDLIKIVTSTLKKKG